jgi:hypothetical protein
MNTVRRWRGWSWILLLPLLLAVGGCGPGVGGTGTGEGFALEYFGARRTSVCNASFAGELKCPSRIVVGPATVPVDDGSDPVIWVDDPSNGRVSARIDLSDIVFEAYCEGITFIGTWGTTGDATDRFFGNYTAADFEVAVPATLSVAAGPSGLEYVLRNADGRIVIGPIALQRLDGETRPATCPKLFSSPVPGPTYR